MAFLSGNLKFYRRNPQQHVEVILQAIRNYSYQAPTTARLGLNR
jgi:hypothetical protein